MKTNLLKIQKNAMVKRRIANESACKIDLQEDLCLLFQAFDKACDLYNKEIICTPYQSRLKGFEAYLLNTKMIQVIQEFFPQNWGFGKYKRFILHKNGYIILFKKLDKKGRPMNVRTKLVESINLQLMGSLFETSGYAEEPILYFGYKRDKYDNIVQPQLLYIDENQVKWTIDKANVNNTGENVLETPESSFATPKLRILSKNIAVNQ